MQCLSFGLLAPSPAKRLVVATLVFAADFLRRLAWLLRSLRLPRDAIASERLSGCVLHRCRATEPLGFELCRLRGIVVSVEANSQAAQRNIQVLRYQLRSIGAVGSHCRFRATTFLVPLGLFSPQPGGNLSKHSARSIACLSAHHPSVLHCVQPGWLVSHVGMFRVIDPKGTLNPAPPLTAHTHRPPSQDCLPASTAAHARRPPD